MANWPKIDKLNEVSFLVQIGLLHFSQKSSFISKVRGEGVEGTLRKSKVGTRYVGTSLVLSITSKWEESLLSFTKIHLGTCISRVERCRK